MNSRNSELFSMRRLNLHSHISIMLYPLAFSEFFRDMVFSNASMAVKIDQQRGGCDFSYMLDIHANSNHEIHTRFFRSDRQLYICQF